MGGTECEIGKEGTIGSNRDGVVNELDRFVDEVFTEVVSLGRSRCRIDSMVVVDEVGGELIGFAIKESVETIETTLQRPCVVGAGCGSFVHGTQMPLPERKGCVANLTQNLAHRGCILRNATSHVRIARIEIGDTAHSDGVVIAACQQRRSSRRAQRRHMEVGKAQTIAGQLVDVGRDHVGAKAVEVRETKIVEEHHDNVGRIVTRVFGRRPPRSRLSVSATNLATKVRVQRHHLAPLIGIIDGVSPRCCDSLRCCART